MTTAVHCWLGFLLVPWLGWTEFCVRLPVLLGDCPGFLPSLPTCVMYPIGCLYLSGYSIVSPNGLPLCPWLCPLLPPRPLLPGVGFGRTSGAAFCCEAMA